MNSTQSCPLKQSDVTVLLVLSVFTFLFVYYIAAQIRKVEEFINHKLKNEIMIVLLQYHEDRKFRDPEMA